MRISNELPIYLQIVQDLTKKICIGTYAAGDKLPSIRDLADTYNANPNTCVKALQILEDLGLLTTVSTSGKFVTEDKEAINLQRQEIYNRFLDNVLKEAKTLQLDVEMLAELLKRRAEVWQK